MKALRRTLQRLVTRSIAESDAAWVADSKESQCEEVPESTEQTENKEINT